MKDISTPIAKAIQLVGAKAIAIACDGISVQAVHKWAAGGVPADRCIAIERVTGGKVSCEELRPDVYCDRTKSTKKRAA